VTTKNGTQSLDEASLARARRLAGLKGYVTNIPAATMPAAEVLASYHGLWQVEASFRMSKTDLRARPIFHHTRDAIEAHLTVVFAALAIARYLQDATGLSIKKIVRTPRPLRDVKISIAGQNITARPEIPADVKRSSRRRPTKPVQLGSETYAATPKGLPAEGRLPDRYRLRYDRFTHIRTDSTRSQAASQPAAPFPA